MTGLLRRHLYTTVALALVFVFLAAFVIVEQLDLPILTDPHPGHSATGWVPGTLGLALLLADVVLPVPSSGVMIVQGAAYGVALGAGLSLVGSTGATLVGFLLGRRSSARLAEWAGDAQHARAVALLDRYGPWAIIATRPIPMVAESVAIMAGTGRLGWWQVTLAGAAGNFIPALAYAAVGAYAPSFINALTVFGLVIALTALAGVLQLQALRRPREHATSDAKH